MNGKFFKALDYSLIISLALQPLWFFAEWYHWLAPLPMIGAFWLFIVSASGRQLDRMGYFKSENFEE